MSMVAQRRCYFDRILSSLFRRLALGIIILIFIEQCHFFTLWLPFRVLPFLSSLFLLARVAVLDVDVRIMTSSVMAQ